MTKETEQKLAPKRRCEPIDRKIGKLIALKNREIGEIASQMWKATLLVSL